jgi:hypothetical protein
MEMRAPRSAGLLRNFRRYERKVISVIGRSSVSGQGPKLSKEANCG